MGQANLEFINKLKFTYRKPTTITNSKLQSKKQNPVSTRLPTFHLPVPYMLVVTMIPAHLQKVRRSHTSRAMSFIKLMLYRHIAICCFETPVVTSKIIKSGLSVNGVKCHLEVNEGQY